MSLSVPNNFKHKRAQKLFDEACKLESAQEDKAIRLYEQAIKLNSKHQSSLYNLGLIYKYRRQWELSLVLNQRVYSLDKEKEAARWNMAIAATALHKWDIARHAWSEHGIELDDDDGPIEINLGVTPVRLNPEGKGEVVWGCRIDPVRIRIINIPFRETGYRHGDIVLHDGAPVGYRTHGQKAYPVFNVLDMFEQSPCQTFNCEIIADNENQVNKLRDMLVEADCFMEDWTQNTRMVCSCCSECNIDQPQTQAQRWECRRSVGIAGINLLTVKTVLYNWEIRTSSRFISIQ